MKKCLVFGISSQLGGVESFLFNYIRFMKKENNLIEFEYVVIDKVPDFFYLFEPEAKVHVVPNRIKNPVKYIQRLKQILCEKKYDIVWYNVCTLSDITLLKLAKKYNISCRIVHSHNNENMGGTIVGFLHKWQKMQIQNYATEFFACSKEAGDFMFAPNIKDERIKIVKNAIEVEKYTYNSETRRVKRMELGISDEMLIGHVGRFHFQKNHTFLIKIFEKIVSLKCNTKLLLIGEGGLKPEIIKMAETLGVREKIIFLEKRMDINELLQAMDVFLFPSVFEGLGIALIEAQAADLPCVISDVIPKEAHITNKVYTLSLKDSPKRWAEKVINEAENDIRRSQIEKFREKGYDIS